MILKMISSMTGYGRGEAASAALSCVVELRSVNHRYFEFSSRVPRGYAFLEEKLNAEISKSGDLVKFLRDSRTVKNDIEIANIKAAQEITDQTFKYILPRIEAGRTEREIMLDMEFYLRRLGSEGVSFDFIVVLKLVNIVPDILL